LFEKPHLRSRARGWPHLTSLHLAAAAILIRQSDMGDPYYAMASGELDVLQNGHWLRRCGRGDGDRT
jgi:CRP-like cAMP-binding protein